jgi:2-dehydropantoate 2-reductase
MDETARIVVAGAGSVGCFVGGSLAAAGRDVTLLARLPLAQAIAARGLWITDLEARGRHVGPDAIGLAVEPSTALRDADLVLVTVKSGDTEAMAGLIAAHAPPQAVVLSLQNGVDNVPLLRARLPGRTVVAGMVPFNVVQTAAEATTPRFHRATAGSLTVETGHSDIVALLSVEGLPVATHPDMAGLAWSKLVLNLNNALNALSGQPLKAQLSRRAWRLLLADQMAEALAVARRAGLALSRIEGVRPALIPHLLRLPDPLFRLVARRMLAIDPQATSSMAEDIARSRRTEVRFLQGAVARLAAEHGRRAPLAEAMVAMVEACEAGRRDWSPTDVTERFSRARIDARPRNSPKQQ